MEAFIGKHVVVRSSPSGVWLGILHKVDGDTTILKDARRAWSWEGAATCSGLAVEGPRGGRICSPVPLARIGDVCEILLALPEAVARWESVKPWVA